MKFAPQMSHCAIYVKDLDRLAAFYSEVLGLVVSDEGRGMTFEADFVFFTGDPDKHHQFVLVTGRDTGTPSTVNQISFRVETIEQLRIVRDRAVKAGAPKISPLNHGNALSIYIQDFEGNTIEVYLDTPWYRPQPCGFPLDLSESDDEIMRKTEEICRSHEKFMTRADWMAEVSSRIRKALDGSPA